uniref:Uncharacterized protein n=1 Tax=Acrobeloides nanus TaxID=290746 RepID=A0A914DIB3_9BILA
QISAYVVTQPSTVTSHSARNRNENLYQNQLVGIEATARQQRAEILQEEQRRQQEQQQRQRYDEERRRRAEEERQRQLQQQQRQQQQQYNTVHNHGPVGGQLTPEQNQRRQENYADTRYSIEKDPRYQQRLEQAQHQRQQQTYANQRSNDYSRAP